MEADIIALIESLQYVTYDAGISYSNFAIMRIPLPFSRGWIIVINWIGKLDLKGIYFLIVRLVKNMYMYITSQRGAIVGGIYGNKLLKDSCRTRIEVWTERNIAAGVYCGFISTVLDDGLIMVEACYLYSKKGGHLEHLISAFFFSLLIISFIFIFFYNFFIFLLSLNIQEYLLTRWYKKYFLCCYTYWCYIGVVIVFLSLYVAFVFILLDCRSCGSFSFVGWAFLDIVSKKEKIL